MEKEIQDIGELAARCELMAHEHGVSREERRELVRRAKEYRRIQESLLLREQVEQETVTRQPYPHADAALQTSKDVFTCVTRVAALMVVLGFVLLYVARC